MTARRLIVNADDFGLSPETNRGIITAHEQGIVTSASLMVRTSAAAEAADYARRNPRLGVGLHLDLGEWAFRAGEWVPLYHVVSVEDAAAVHAEVEQQLAAFRVLLGRDPTHLDSHQHVHRREPVRDALVTLGRRLGVPVRHFTPAVRYCGDFYGQDGEGNSFPHLVTPGALVGILERLGQGVTELCCHPGFDPGLDTTYVAERAAEVAALCDPLMRAAVDRFEVELVSFRELAGEVGPP
jgi:predicted glycoside hydrolase/deacetylase ChbG (UPF0249 family)